MDGVARRLFGNYCGRCSQIMEDPKDHREVISTEGWCAVCRRHFVVCEPVAISERNELIHARCEYRLFNA